MGWEWASVYILHDTQWWGQAVSVDGMGECVLVYILRDTQWWGQAVHMKHLILRRNRTQQLFSTIEVVAFIPSLGRDKLILDTHNLQAITRSQCNSTERQICWGPRVLERSLKEHVHLFLPSEDTASSHRYKQNAIPCPIQDLGKPWSWSSQPLRLSAVNSRGQSLQL